MKHDTTLNPPVEAVQSDRRSGVDRRQHSPFRINWRHLGFQGRRKAHRRLGQSSAGQVLDWYGLRMTLPVILIVILSGCDAFMTLNLLQLGAYEANPLMARLIDEDIRRFVNFKLALTALSALLLVVYGHYRFLKFFRVYHLLWLAAAGYTMLIVYELGMLRHLQAVAPLTGG